MTQIKKLVKKFYSRINPCYCTTLWCPVDDAAHKIRLHKFSSGLARFICDKHDVHIMSDF